MIDFLRQAPGWIGAHPWLSALTFCAGLAAFSSLILANPNGRQARDFWRKKR